MDQEPINVAKGFLTPDEAQKLYPKTGILILQGCPKEIELGIDNISWKICQKFKGFKLIPLGSHYIHFAQKDEDYQYRLGFFIVSKPGEVCVKTYNEETNRFENLLDKDLESRYVSAAKNLEFDEFLAAYPYEKYQLWNDSSNYIDQALLDKLEISGDKVISGTTNEYKNNENCQRQLDENIEALASELDDARFVRVRDAPKAKAQDGDSMVQENLPPKDLPAENPGERFEPFAELNDGAIKFSEVNGKKANWGLQGQALTDAYFDRSTVLKELISREFAGKDDQFLGELQFSFVVFLLGENYEGFDQWKKMFHQATNCKKLVIERPELYKKFIRVVFSQVKQFPKDFFSDSLTKDNFLGVCVKSFFRNLEDQRYCGVEKVILGRAEKLKKLMVENFGLVFGGSKDEAVESGEEDIPEDEMPVVVEDFDFVKFQRFAVGV